jgi:hypothetical protein
VLVREFLDGHLSFAAEPGFIRSRRVVKASMQHAAVVSCLMRSELALFFQKREPEIGFSKQ